MEGDCWNRPQESDGYEVEQVLQEEIPMEESTDAEWEANLAWGNEWYHEVDGVFW